MALDLSNLAPVKGSGLTSRSTGREAEANPFLDNGWLMDSYNEQQDYELTVPGGWEDAVKLRGKSKGQPYQKLVGDAATVVRMLRDAADKNGIGVAIQVVPAVKVVNKGRSNERTDEIPGYVTVKYLGKVRKVYNAREDTGNGGEPQETDETPDDTDDDDSYGAEVDD